VASANWTRIEELFHEALQLPPADRAAFLAHECQSNKQLLTEVNSLLAEFDGNSQLIDSQPAFSLGLKVLAESMTVSLVGESILHYKVLKLLGRGGMGEVYLAQDTNLEREVALKFLAPGLVDDAVASEQLMNEARSISKLHNPNICVVHGLEKVNGYNFIVMQYIEGEPLSSLLQAGPLEVKRALEFAEQIVSALCAAHAHGIIHRDIKPQNIVVDLEGQAKVLDFGLAKLVQLSPEMNVSGKTEAPSTRVEPLMGTVAYMSPEQAKGEALDFRTDIFSFGIVLYEMLTGKNPFVFKTTAATLEAIRSTAPARPTTLPKACREELSAIVFKCLEKDSTQRFATTEELLSAIRTQRKLLEPPDPALIRERVRRRRKLLQRVAAVAAVFLVMSLVAAFYLRMKLTEVHSLAILPIINKSDDPKIDYLGVGLTRNLFDKFSYLPRLKLKTPTVVTTSNGLPPDLAKMGRELGVEALLAGEVAKEGNSVWLRIKMLKVEDGSQIWNKDFNLTAGDLFALQNDITQTVASRLGLWLVGHERELLNKRQTNSQDALTAYMWGRHFYSLKRDRENIKTAVRYFDQAVEIDPAFAKAYAGRADCYLLMGTVLYGPLAPKEAMDKARYDARQAIEIDPSLPEAHTSMGSIRFKYDWQWQRAEEEFKRAIELDSEYAPAHYEYANLLAVLKRFDESIRQSEIARELDPHSPLAQMNYGRALYFSRQFDRAELYFRTLLDEKPEQLHYQYLMGLVLIVEHKYLPAIDVLEHLHDKDPIFAASVLGYAYGKIGRVADAERILRELDDFSKQQPVTPLEKGIVLIGLGNRKEAISMLEKAYEDRFVSLVYLTTDPLFDDLRSEPKFLELAQRMTLPL